MGEVCQKMKDREETWKKLFSLLFRLQDIRNLLPFFLLRKYIYIVDMGVNFTGLYRIRLKGQPGDTITFRFGERLYENGTLNPMTAVAVRSKKKGSGGPGSPDVAWQTDSYIFGDKTEEWYTPLFTFHVFRYMEISGLKYKPDITDIEGIVI